MLALPLPRDGRQVPGGPLLLDPVAVEVSATSLVKGPPVNGGRIPAPEGSLERTQRRVHRHICRRLADSALHNTSHLRFSSARGILTLRGSFSGGRADERARFVIRLSAAGGAATTHTHACARANVCVYKCLEAEGPSSPFSSLRRCLREKLFDQSSYFHALPLAIEHGADRTGGRCRCLFTREICNGKRTMPQKLRQQAPSGYKMRESTEPNAPNASLCEIPHSFPLRKS